MENIQIQTGEICLSVNGDTNRIIRFNPSDLLFVEKYYRLVKESDGLFAEFETRAKELDKNQEKDASGLPVNAGEILQLLKDLCTFINSKIDEVFGVGTSQVAFNGMLDFGILGSNGPSIYEQFFNQVGPYIQKARSKKIEKYLTPPVRNAKRRVRASKK